MDFPPLPVLFIVLGKQEKQNEAVHAAGDPDDRARIVFQELVLIDRPFKRCKVGIDQS
jgi:hypothetical protein